FCPSGSLLTPLPPGPSTTPTSYRSGIPVSCFRPPARSRSAPPCSSGRRPRSPTRHRPRSCRRLACQGQGVGRVRIVIPLGGQAEDVGIRDPSGAVVGAVVGILFPPSIIVAAGVGAAIGGVSGHLWRGMSRADVKEFGEVIDDGAAALVVVGE